MPAFDPPQRRRRFGVRWYLGALCLVPLAGMVFFAAGGIANTARAMSGANRLSADLSRREAVLEFQHKAALEALYSTLTVRTEARPVPGLDQTVVGRGLGRSIADSLRDARLAVDREIVRLELSNSYDGDKSDEGRAAQVLAELPDVRRRLDARQIPPEAVDAYFGRVLAASSDLAERSTRDLLVEATSTPRLRALVGYLDASHRAAMVQQSAGAQLIYLGGLLAPGGQWVLADTRIGLAAAFADEGGGMTRLALAEPTDLSASVITLSSHDTWRTYAGGVPTFASWAGLAASTPESSSGDPIQRVQLLAVGVGRLDAIGVFNDAILKSLNEQVESVRAAILANLVANSVIAIGVAVVVILVMIVASRAIIAPLKRLEAGANALVHSAVEVVDIQVSGPSEVAAVGTALAALRYELVIAEAQAAAVGVANWQSPILAAPSRMAIGVSLRQAIHTLTGLVSQLKSRERIAKAVFDNSADPVWTVDENLIIRSANKATQELLGWAVESMVGASFRDLLATDDDQTLFEILRKQGSIRDEMRLRHVNGRAVSALIAGAVTSFDNELLTTIIAHDITDRKELEGRLEHQATHDTLTGLANRAAAVKHLEEALNHANLDSSDTALLFVDLDRFKLVNDSHGHRGGDALLGAIADRMRLLESATVMPARLGGDEFVVVLAHAQGIESAVRLAQDLIAHIEQPYTINSITHTISASVGIAYAVGGRASALGMLRDADHAVYQAKQRGGACVQVFDEVLREAVDLRARTEVDLRRAIERDELVLYYQPIVHAVTGELRGVEALVRWQHPTRGLVFPDKFIPLAEESMLIVDLGRWVLRAAAQQVAQWQQMLGLPFFTVSVNVSGRHVVDADVVSDVTQILADTHADPRRLKVEVTESRLIAEIDSSARAFQRLRELGIGISIDDFGTGYSGFTNMRSFPIDQVKIDRSFVRNVGTHHQDTAIVETVINLARAFEIDVVAEGVETDEQRRHLAVRGCPLIQGWLIAPAMRLDAFSEWIVRELPEIQLRLARQSAPR